MLTDFRLNYLNFWQLDGLTFFHLEQFSLRAVPAVALSTEIDCHVGRYSSQLFMGSFKFHSQQ